MRVTQIETSITRLLKNFTQDLKEAYHQLDLVLERCYHKKLFESDEEPLAYLFKLDEAMASKESLK